MSSQSRGPAPRPRLTVRIDFWSRRALTLLGVARMVIRTQGFPQLCRFAWRKLTRTFAADRSLQALAPVQERLLQRRVSVIIPSYQQTTLVSDCVASIWKSIPSEDRG